MVLASEYWPPSSNSKCVSRFMFNVRATDPLAVISLADPSFCELAPDESGVFTVQSDSPCAPANSPCGELIGRDPVGCGTEPVEPVTWGGVKSIYR